MLTIENNLTRRCNKSPFWSGKAVADRNSMRRGWNVLCFCQNSFGACDTEMWSFHSRDHASRVTIDWWGYTRITLLDTRQESGLVTLRSSAGCPDDMSAGFDYSRMENFVRQSMKNFDSPSCVDVIWFLFHRTRVLASDARANSRIRDFYSFQIPRTVSTCFFKYALHFVGKP